MIVPPTTEQLREMSAAPCPYWHNHTNPPAAPASQEHTMTQHYTGTKIVEAWPQKQIQGQDVHEGYAVKYADGYTSWSPKAAFEAAYLPLGHIGHLPPHVQRMHGEHAELNDRFTKLCAFLETDTFAGLPEDDRHLLEAQATSMRAYLNALTSRINRAMAAFDTAAA